MKFSNECVNRLRISTVGMKEFNILNQQKVALTTGLFDEIKLTKFYRDEGQLPCSRDEPLAYAIYIQREDGECFVTFCYGTVYFDCVKNYLSPMIKAEVILCKVPSRYVRHF